MTTPIFLASQMSNMEPSRGDASATGTDWHGEMNVFVLRSGGLGRMVEEMTICHINNDLHQLWVWLGWRCFKQMSFKELARWISTDTTCILLRGFALSLLSSSLQYSSSVAVNDWMKKKLKQVITFRATADSFFWLAFIIFWCLTFFGIRIKGIRTGADCSSKNQNTAWNPGISSLCGTKYLEAFPQTNIKISRSFKHTQKINISIYIFKEKYMEMVKIFREQEIIIKIKVNP